MRIVVVGPTGNLGTSALGALEKEESVESVLGLARRLPGLTEPKVEWVAADVVDDDLVPHFRGADAVVLLSWGSNPPATSPNSGWLTSKEARGSPGPRRRQGCLAPLRFVGRGLLARAERPSRRRELADRGHHNLVLRTSQGRGRTEARPLRA